MSRLLVARDRWSHLIATNKLWMFEQRQSDIAGPGKDKEAQMGEKCITFISLFNSRDGEEQLQSRFKQ